MQALGYELVLALGNVQYTAIENMDFGRSSISNGNETLLDNIWKYGNVMLYDIAVHSEITRADIDSDYYQIKIKNFTDRVVWHPYVCRVCVYPNFETPDELRTHEEDHIDSGIIHCGKCRMKFDNMDDLRTHDPYCNKRFGDREEINPQEGTPNWLRRQELYRIQKAKEDEKQDRDVVRRYEWLDRNTKKCFFCCKRFRLAEYYSHSLTCSKRRGRSETWDQKKGLIPQTHHVVKYRKRNYNKISR